ncbi:MAG TPA: exonuclease SbcCD subunit D [Geminicoccaceae bacterium]|nr:exonuclease SbcCD subunit D [Geminicoccaceae bacterium]
MRFLHTADWHLGRYLHGVSLVEDQAHLLDEFVALARDVRPAAVLLSGDVYDRAVPPTEAVALLDDVLCRLLLDLRLPVIVIAGNHDSPHRLGFAARLLSAVGLRVIGAPQSAPAPVVLEDRHGAIEVFCLPYAEPSEVRARLGVDVRDHDGAMRAQVGSLARDGARRAVLLGHAFVVGGAECESERPLSVGGAGTVCADCFDGFAYVALGHLHRPQAFGDGGRVRYCGSLLPYSFSEAGHAKSVSVVEIDRGGAITIEEVALTPRRGVRRLSGTLDALLSGPGCDDYVEVTLEDKGALLDPMGRLRAVYPHLLHVRRLQYAPDAPPQGPGRGAERRGVVELFGDFFEQVTGAPAGAEEVAAFAEVYEEWRRAEEREVVAP